MSTWILHPYNDESPILKPFGSAVRIPKTDAQIRELAESVGLTEADVRAEMDMQAGDPLFKNGDRPQDYQVALHLYGDDDLNPDLIHISVKRIDKKPIHDWRHLQEIKNMIVGPEYEGVELYPAESRVVDTANQFHLWVFYKDKDRLKKFGFPAGIKSDVAQAGGAIQRPRSEMKK